jgi:hypothetical protein
MSLAVTGVDVADKSAIIAGKRRWRAAGVSPLFLFGLSNCGE